MIGKLPKRRKARGLLEMFQALATVLIFGNSIFVVYLHFMLNLKRSVALSLIWQVG